MSYGPHLKIVQTVEDSDIALSFTPNKSVESACQR